ncbi:MAG: sugar transferase [Anaerolineae bacterium]
MQRHTRVLMLIHALLDFVLMNVAFGLAYGIRYILHFPSTVLETNYIQYQAYIPISLALSLGLLAIYRFEGVYTYVRGRSLSEEMYGLLRATFEGIVIVVFFFFLFRPDYYSRLIYFFAGALIILILTLERGIVRAVIGRLRKQGRLVDRVLIVGCGESGRAILRSVIAQPGLGYRIIGYIDDDASKGNLGPFRLLGDTDYLAQVLREYLVDEVIITLPWHARDKIMQMMEISEAAGARVKIVPDLFQLSLSQVRVDAVGGIPLIGVNETAISGANLALKRSMDLGLTFIAFIVLLPLMALVALLIKLTSPGPVIFSQERVGRNEKRFTAYKFRTMRVGAEQEVEGLKHLNEADGPLFKIRNDPRLTAIGKLLRRLSFDELPQFWNVLRGDMSLVGPRPPIPAEVAQYQDWHKKRLQITPGLTGLWQVSGRSELTFDEMVMLDIYYVENWSPWLDLWILVRTVPSVLTARGAY